MATLKQQDPNAAIALGRYLGEAEYEAYQRPSGIWGVKRKPLYLAPDWGTTKVSKHDQIAFLLASPVFVHWTAPNQHIRQGQPVPY